jgi:hypothetical protein
MPVSLELEENGTLLVWKFSDPWTVPELVVHYPKTAEYFNNAQNTIHSLIDFRNVRTLPANVFSARNTTTWNHPRSGQMVILGASPLIKNLLEVILKLVRFERIRFFESEEEARAYIRACNEKVAAQAV